MASVKQVLVVGGSIGGMAAALRLKHAGAEVEIVELDPGWGGHGAGLTLTGASLRAFDHLGVLRAIREQGFVCAGTQLVAPDCRKLGELPLPPEPQTVHLNGGILRPVLHGILSSATRAAGIGVALGLSVSSLEDDGERVRTSFTDGREQRYDLVVGADGIHSRVRELAFAGAPKPQFTGQGCYRMLAPRSAAVDKPTMVAGYDLPLGFIPVSATGMYLFALEHLPDNPRIEARDYPERLRGLMRGLGGFAAGVRDAIDASSVINYRPLESILVPPAWHRGRVVLLGDAAHATTPHLATGAGLAVEDALVLGEEMERAESVDRALVAYAERRYPRCRAVVETSLAIGACQMTRVDPQRALGLLQQGFAILQAPY